MTEQDSKGANEEDEDAMEGGASEGFRNSEGEVYRVLADVLQGVNIC